MSIPQYIRPGQAPQLLKDELETRWESTRTGRADVPDVVADPDTEKGVYVVNDREDPHFNSANHDLIHVYHPDAGGLDRRDRGHREQGVGENMQIDIVLSDRPDPSTGDRLNATKRMVGDRDSDEWTSGDLHDSGGTLGGASGFTLGSSSGGTLGHSGRVPRVYPGILGETWFVLEKIRRGSAEFDRFDFDIGVLSLRNSNARAAIDVTASVVAVNTVD